MTGSRRSPEQLARQKEVLHLSLFGDLSLREIAERLGVSSNTVLDDLIHEQRRRVIDDPAKLRAAEDEQAAFYAEIARLVQRRRELRDAARRSRARSITTKGHP